MKKYLFILILISLSSLVQAQGTKDVLGETAPIRAEMNIYPNPVIDFVNVAFNEPAERIEIYNLIGKRVKVEIVQSQTERFNLGDLHSGIYIAQLIGKNNKVLGSQRLQKR